jgi:CxxC motif-containing protein
VDKRKIKKYETFSEDLKQFIEKKYKECYSTTQVVKSVNELYNLHLGRGAIEEYLKYIKIYEGLTGENYLKNKVEKNKKVMMERYGVENWGQTSDGGYKAQNKIPYDKIPILSKDFKRYKLEVEKVTKQNKKHIKNIDFCFYTGIRFVDTEQEKVNPNDPRKRSIDHKIPIIICFLNNISPEIAGGIDNLIFVLKYVNSIKGNTLHESFLSIAPKIRKVFINEGYKSI